MSKTTSIANLLRQWAEVEPERCRFIEGGYDMDYEWPDHFEYLHNDGEWVPEWSGLALQCTMQAIEARGWDMNLSSEDEDHIETGVKIYTGEIKAPMTDAADGLKWHSGEPNPCPAYALLEAYLVAIKASVEV